MGLAPSSCGALPWRQGVRIAANGRARPGLGLLLLFLCTVDGTCLRSRMLAPPTCVHECAHLPLHLSTVPPHPPLWPPQINSQLGQKDAVVSEGAAVTDALEKKSIRQRRKSRDLGEQRR